MNETFAPKKNLLVFCNYTHLGYPTFAVFKGWGTTEAGGEVYRAHPTLKFPVKLARCPDTCIIKTAPDLSTSSLRAAITSVRCLAALPGGMLISEPDRGTHSTVPPVLSSVLRAGCCLN